MSDYCYVGNAEAVCHLNIGPYQIGLDCVPSGYATKPNDIVLGSFTFAKWDGEPDDYWISSAHGSEGADVLNGNGLLSSIEGWSMGAVAQAANSTYLGDKVYFQIWGNGGDDVITGGNNWDMLFGGSGNDQLNGLGGSDQVYGDSGNDTASGGDGNDWVDGGDDSDQVNGDNGNDNVAGGAGSDVVNGGEGDDNLFGDADGQGDKGPETLDLNGGYHAPENYNDGNDLMDGGNGNDRMFGQGGADDMSGGFGDDGMDGGSGNDAMRGGDGVDNMTGGCGDDWLRGDAGNDMMNGGEGNDVLNGGSGRDWIAGGAGDDEMTGALGKDVFVFCDDGCGGDDYISDFTTGRQRDQIDLTQMFDLDMVISSETGDPNSAFLELVSFGEDGKCGTEDDHSLGTIYIDSAQAIGRVFGLDTTFGKSAFSLVRVADCVLIDLPSDSIVYNGEWI